MKYTLLLVAFATLQPALDATIASAYTIYPDCGGPCPQHVFRTPTPNELVGLDNRAFYDYAVANGVNPDVIDAPFQWTVIDSNANGWVIGYYTGPSFWDGSFVFHAGVGVVCCMMDELTLKMINSNNMVSGTNPWGAVFFNVSDLFGASEFFDPAVYFPDGRPFDGVISALGILNALDDGRIILRDGEMLVPIPSATVKCWCRHAACSVHRARELRAAIAL